MICKNVEHLRQVLTEFHPNQKVWATSGGFDPMHVGHLRCLLETASHASREDGVTVVIVNDDGFLHRKKGYAFMPIEERMEIIAGIRGVDHVVGWDDGTQYVTDAIRLLRPAYFTKGGDRDAAQNVPEFELCSKIDCSVIFGVGGGKIQSSSELVAKVKS